MKGGAYNENELNILRNNGFTDYQIETLEGLNIPIGEVTNKINIISNQGVNGFNGNSDDMSEMVMNEILNEHIFENQNANTTEIEPIPQDNNELHYLDDNTELDLSQDSLHLSDLDDSRMSGYTTSPDESFGGKKRMKSKTMKKKNKSNSKKKHTKKTRKNYRKKNRKQKGGMCHGNGVGSNMSNSNFSIYNTRELELFPYRTT